MTAETILFLTQPPFRYQHPKTRNARHTYVNLKRRSRRASTSRTKDSVLCEYLRTLDVSTKAHVRLHYFVHVPKTGGAALKLALQNSNSVIPSCTTVQSVLLRGLGHNRYTRVVSVGHNDVRTIDPRVPTFCILRDPYERIRSAFRYVMEGGKNAPIWNMPQKHTMNTWRKQNIRSVSDLFATPARRKTTLEHTHFRPMTEFVTDVTGKMIVDHVFFQEELDPHSIADYLGIRPFELPVKNSSDLPYTLTESDRECIATYYANDLILYNTQRERWEKRQPQTNMKNIYTGKQHTNRRRN